MTASVGTSETSSEDMSTGSMVATLLPLVFLVVFSVAFFRYARRSSKRSADYVKSMESKSDEMIALLKEIRDTLANRPR